MPELLAGAPLLQELAQAQLACEETLALWSFKVLDVRAVKLTSGSELLLDYSRPQPRVLVPVPLCHHVLTA